MHQGKTIVTALFIFMCFLVAFRFLIFTSCISVKKSAFRKELLSQGVAMTTTIHLPKNELYKNSGGREWKENGRELVIHNVYFEIVSIREVDGRVEITLIEDEKESKLFAHYFKLNAESSPVPGFEQLLLGLDFLNAWQEISFDMPEVSFSYAHLPSLPLQDPFCDFRIKPPGA